MPRLDISSFTGIAIGGDTFCLERRMWTCSLGLVSCGRGTDPWDGDDFGNDLHAFWHPGTPYRSAYGGRVLNFSSPPYLHLPGGLSGYLKKRTNTITFERGGATDSVTFQSLGVEPEQYQGGPEIDFGDIGTASSRTTQGLFSGYWTIETARPFYMDTASSTQNYGVQVRVSNSTYSNYDPGVGTSVTGETHVLGMNNSGVESPYYIRYAP